MAHSRGFIAEILPPSVVVEEMFGDFQGGTLLPEEAQAVAAAAAKRRNEFAAGRACAHRALAVLGIAPAPILMGPKREPLWPAGAVGSITHCLGYAAATVAWQSDLASVGIDAEEHAPLPSGVLREIASVEECDMLARLPRNGVCWDRLLFSAKESIYKAWFPLTGRWLGFTDVAATILPDAMKFSARLLKPAISIGGQELTEFRGSYVVRDGLLFTAVIVEHPS